MRLIERLQIKKINNLIGYLLKNYDSTNNVCTLDNFFNSALNINEEIFFRIIKQFDEVENIIDILIISISYLEIFINKKLIKISKYNIYTILWITCLLSYKYVSSFDIDISVEYLANLGGYSLNDYIKIEKIFVKQLDWKLEINEKEYNRLQKVSHGILNM